MKRLTFLMLSLGLVIGLSAATITVGDLDGSTYKFPIRADCNYSYSQQIYKKSHINLAGEIYKIRFYHDGSDVYPNDLVNSHNWRVYMGHVARNSFASTSDWVPTSQLTQVFSGNVYSNFPAYGGWMEITLQTPFNYDNVNNLVVAVYENTPGHTFRVDWGCFRGGFGTGLSFYSNSSNPDPNNLPEACWRDSDIPTLQLLFTDSQAPFEPRLVRPYGNEQIMNGYFLEWKLAQNSPDATGYDVYIDGAIVSSNQTATRFKLNGLEAGTHSWYVVARNQFGDSPPSSSRDFVIYPGVEIGNCSADNGLPIDPAAHYSYTQTIYLKSEIDNLNHQTDAMGYSIERLAFYWNGGGAYSNSREWTIYMGHTDRTSFVNNVAWIPVNQMVKVYEKRFNVYDYPHWLAFELDTPFLYNNTDNLVIAVHERCPGFDPSNLYFHSTDCGPNRTLKFCRWNENTIDLNYLPRGNLVAAHPNILIQTGELLTAPIISISPTELNYNVVVNSQSSTLDVIVSNVGIGSLNLAASDISIIGPNADHFSFDPENLPASLGHRESVTIPVTVNGITAGLVSATLRIGYGGENYDVALNAEVTVAGVITIGDGTAYQGFPFSTEYYRSCSAALYTADQIDAIGTLQMIGWDCVQNHSEGHVIHYRIFAKNTHDSLFEVMPRQNLTAGMTLLKQGSFDFSTEGWHVFQLDTPFVYTGANLIIMVETDSQYQGHNWRSYKYTDVGTRRHLSSHFYEGNTGIMYPDSHVPNVMLHFVSDIEDDLCAVYVDGPLAPAQGAASDYTVRIRNNGNNIQTNYQVKLMGPNNTVLASVNGPTVTNGEVVDVVVPWTPATPGQIGIYAKVEMDGDELDINNRTNTFTVDVPPVNHQAVTIGSGDQLYICPVNFVRRASLYETIYLEDELGITNGTITSMVIYNSFFDHLAYTPTQIFLGTTDRVNLSNGFIPASQLALVFNGPVTYPYAKNNIVINFQTPFVYTGGNLVMMYYHPYETYYSEYPNYFRSQRVENDRSRDCWAYVEALDPYNPPEGGNNGYIPITTFFVNPECLENDLSAVYIRGSQELTVGEPTNHTIRIRNNGIVDQDNYNVKIVGPDGVELASMAGPPIDGLQTLDVEIPWTPTTAGRKSIYGKVEMVGDEIAVNNSTSAFQIMVYPDGVSDVLALLNDANDAVQVYWEPPDTESTDLVGYMVHRLKLYQDEELWVAVTQGPTTAHSVTDLQWSAIPRGTYRWAVKAVYSDGSFSRTSFSNPLSNNVPSSNIVGTVRSQAGSNIAGARISNGIVFTFSNQYGRFNLDVPFGTHTVTASASQYCSQTVENVIVEDYSAVNINFVLEPGTPNDDPQTPAVTTVLHGNYPNPFNPETTISYSIEEAGRVRLDIYNIKGQLVRTLLNEDQAAGHYKRVFNGRDDSGRSLPSGVYFVRMTAPGYQKNSKMVLMK